MNYIFQLPERKYDKLGGCELFFNFYESFSIPNEIDEQKLYKLCFARLNILNKLYELKHTENLKKLIPNVYLSYQGEEAFKDARKTFEKFLPDGLFLFSVTSENVSHAYKNGNVDTILPDKAGETTSNFYDPILCDKPNKRKRMSLSSNTNCDTTSVRDPRLIKEHYMRDNFSFFVLLFVFSQTTDDIFNWWKEQELMLFVIRFCLVSFGYVDNNKFCECLQYIHDTNMIIDSNKLHTEYAQAYLKFPLCAEVSDCIRCNSAIIYKGIVYVRHVCLFNIIKSNFEIRLKKMSALDSSHAAGSLYESKIKEFYNKVPAFKFLVHAIKNFQKLKSSQASISRSLKYTANANFKPLMYSDLLKAKSIFPPCMYNITNMLKQNRHLKYNGRLLLWPFLKDCGMKIEDVIAFSKEHWRNTGEFEKTHLYSIRHIFGLEGQKQQKNCYSCAKIINDFTVS